MHPTGVVIMILSLVGFCFITLYFGDLQLVPSDTYYSNAGSAAAGVDSYTWNGHN